MANGSTQLQIIKAITPRVADLVEFEGMDFEEATDRALREWADYLVEMAEGQTQRSLLVRNKIEERVMDGVGV